MKNKIFIGAITLMLALSMAGCSKNETNETNETTKPSETSAEETVEAVEESKPSEKDVDTPADSDDDEDAGYDLDYMRSYSDIEDSDLKYSPNGDLSDFVSDPDLQKVADEFAEKGYDSFMSPEAYIQDSSFFLGDGLYYFKNGFGAIKCSSDDYRTLMVIKAPQKMVEEMVFLGDSFESEEKDGIITYHYQNSDHLDMKYDTGTQIFSVESDESMCPKG